MVQSPPSARGTSSRSPASATRSATWCATLITRDRLCCLRLAWSGWKRVTGRSPRSSTSMPASRSAPSNPALRRAPGAFSWPGPCAPALEGTPITPSISLRYVDANQNVRAISKHPPKPLGRGPAPTCPAIHDQVLDRLIDLVGLDELDLSLDRRSTSRHRQPHPGILAPARHPNRVRVVEKVEVPIGRDDEPGVDRPLPPGFTRADQERVGAIERVPEVWRQHARQNKPVTRVVLLGLDGFPHRAIGLELTPRLWDLARRGGRAPGGGVTDLPSSTDPGFCSLLTGCKPATHGVLTTSWRFARLPDWAGLKTPRVPAIFDACRAVGVRTAAIVADDRGLLCTGSADRRWPPDGVIPPGTALDAHGYTGDAAVLPPLLAAVADSSLGFVFGHINEADTVGHDDGPESDPAHASYRATDQLVGEVLDALKSRWADTVVVIVSDHDMQSRDSSPPVDPMANGSDGWDGYIPAGGSALIHLKPGVDPEHAGAALLRIDGVESWLPATDSVL